MRSGADQGPAALDARPAPGPTASGPPRIAVVIPCYNTSSSCLEVIRRALAVTGAVLAVDDGSTDDTAEWLIASGAPSVRLPRNQGKGVALRAGIAEVLKGPAGVLGGTFDAVVTLDGDGQHDPDHIPRLVECARRERADLVIGVRDVELMPPKSKFGNRVSRSLFRIATGLYIPDTQSGLRLFSAELAAALVGSIRWRRYESEMEVLSKTVAMGFRIATVEVPTIYFDANRRTHFDPFWDSLRVFGVLFRQIVVRGVGMRPRAAARRERRR